MALYDESVASAGGSPPYISLVNLLADILPEIEFENRLDPGPGPHYPAHGLWLVPLYRQPIPDPAPAVQSISERAVRDREEQPFVPIRERFLNSKSE